MSKILYTHSVYVYLYIWGSKDILYTEKHIYMFIYVCVHIHVSMPLWEVLLNMWRFFSHFQISPSTDTEYTWLLDSETIETKGQREGLAYVYNLAAWVQSLETTEWKKRTNYTKLSSGRRRSSHIPFHNISNIF